MILDKFSFNYLMGSICGCCYHDKGNELSFNPNNSVDRSQNDKNYEERKIQNNRYDNKISLNPIQSEKEEVYIGGKEKYAVLVKRFFPGLFSKIVRKAKVT